MSAILAVPVNQSCLPPIAWTGPIEPRNIENKAPLSEGKASEHNIHIDTAIRYLPYKCHYVIYTETSSC